MAHWIRRSSVVLVLAAFFAVGASQAQAQSGSSSELAGATTKQKLDFTREVLEEMQDGVKDVDRMLDAAQKEGDADKIACVKDKLASLKALKDVTERAQGEMTEAFANNLEERAEHELRKVGVAASKFRQFYAEAAACVGEASVDGAIADVTMDTDVPTDEGETDEQRGEVEIDEDPPPMTPFE